MKNSEILELTTVEIENKILDEKTSLGRMKMNHAISPLENPMKIRDARRLVARLETELSKRFINEAQNS